MGPGYPDSCQRDQPRCAGELTSCREDFDQKGRRKTGASSQLSLCFFLQGTASVPFSVQPGMYKNILVTKHAQLHSDQLGLSTAHCAALASVGSYITFVLFPDPSLWPEGNQISISGLN